MKQVGILTSHASINYGGLLQAWALRKVILSEGFSCDVINYQPNMHDAKRHPIRFVLNRKQGLRKAAFALQHYGAYKQRSGLIREFVRESIKPAPEQTVSLSELTAVTGNYHVLCCGSDQLWNLNQPDNANRAYLLDFPHQSRAVSYAVSFGDGLKLSRDKIEDALPLIRRFDAISVRDEDGQAFLQSHGIDAEITLDPTLLLEQEDWTALVNEVSVPVPSSYILVYGYENAYQRYEDLVKSARQLSRLTGLPVVNPLMTPKLAVPDFQQVFAVCGPKELFYLVKNAAIVCTNSFHGTIFSYLNRRPMLIVSGRAGPDGRKRTLAALLNLEDRIVTPDENWNINVLTRPVETATKLEEAKRRSLEFLRRTLR